MIELVFAGIVLAWYALESVLWLVAALRPPNREIPLVFLLPRLVCTLLGIAVTYWLGLPWTQVILFSFVATILLETLTRQGLRFLAPPLVERARQHLEPASSERTARMGALRAVAATFTALLLVAALSLTALIYVARETLFDARVWTDNLHQSGLYASLVRFAVDEARSAARNQGGDASQVAQLLTEDDLALVASWILPEPWTTTWLQESLDATLGWMQTPSNQRVPPISVPVADIERHVQDAASLLLDQYLPALPLCTPNVSRTAYCRPLDMSGDAYHATYKPQSMSIADEILELVPAELDLSTAVALFGKPFREPLSYLERARAAVQELNHGLTLAGLLCLGLWAVLWMLSGLTRTSRLRWIGATLLLAALLTWAASYAALRLLPRRFFPTLSAGLPTSLAVPLQDFGRAMLDTLNSRVLAGALGVGFLGLLLLWTPMLAPHNEVWTRRTPFVQATRAGVILLAVLGVLWILYARIGARLYSRANQMHRDGDVESANTLYRQIDRFYPLRDAGFAHDSQGHNFVDRARRDQRECQLYLDAQAAYRAAEWQTAVQHYEALWLTQPALVLRDSAETQQVQALIQWARALEANGQRERALDRYRFVRDQDLARDRQMDGQPIRIHRTIGNLYLDWGDERLDQDPEAALATYRRALIDTDDPGVWALVEERMVNAYCARYAQLTQDGQTARADAVCIELGNEFPNLAPNPCTVCSP